MIRVSHTGDFSKLDRYLINLNRKIKNCDLSRFGEEGVDALRKNTPTDSGETANAWYYQIEKTNSSTTINFCNSNIQNGVPIAIILQYGHATRNGGWVEGRDYINPSIQPIFDKIASEAWGEVKRL